MSLRGLDDRSDQAPDGWPTHEQTLWARPWEDGLEDYYEWQDSRPVTRLHQFPVVFGVTADREPASVDTWPPPASNPPPEPSGPAAASVSVGRAPAGSRGQRPQ